MKMRKIEEQQSMVSVIVACYNPVYEKLQRTVCSIIKQKNIEIQLIVVDDGSKEKYFDKLELYIKSMKFKNYILIASECNQGTCRNVMQGLKAANGKYVKAISPGDYLYADTTLSEWYNYMVEKKLRVTFGDAVYYFYDKERFTVLKKISLPQRKELYDMEHYRRKSIMINYICSFDAIIGANFMLETKLFKQYLDEILTVVKYGEDMIFRKMLFDNIQIVYYPQNVIYYEYGTGISTAKNEKWREIISKEIWDMYNFIIKSEEADTFLKKRMFYIMSIASSEHLFRIIKYIVFPSLIYWKCLKKIKPVYTPTNADEEFVKEIHGE